MAEIPKRLPRHEPSVVDGDTRQGRWLVVSAALVALVLAWLTPQMTLGSVSGAMTQTPPNLVISTMLASAVRSNAAKACGLLGAWALLVVQLHRFGRLGPASPRVPHGHNATAPAEYSSSNGADVDAAP